MNERISTIVYLSEGPFILDCGSIQHSIDNERLDDWLFKALQANFESVIGLDYDKDEVEKAQDLDYDIRYADVQNMWFNYDFDTIVAGELIEHLDKPGQFLECCHGHMHEDSALVLSTPNAWAMLHIIRKITGDLDINSEHMSWYDKVTLRQLLERNGFEIEEIRFVNVYKPSYMKLFRGLNFEIGASHIVIKAVPKFYNE